MATNILEVSKCCELGIDRLHGVSCYGSGFVETDPGFFGVFGSESRIQTHVDDTQHETNNRETKSRISMVRELRQKWG
jgi:hypothetical protein